MLPDKARWLPGHRRMRLTFWLLLTVVLLCTASLYISRHFQSIRIERDDADIIHHIEQKAGEMHGLLNSLVSAHYATLGDQSAIVAMAEQLRLDNPKISAVGRFQTILLWQREAFEEQMTETGLYAFHIADLIDGQRLPSRQRPKAKPISFLDPMTPEMLPLLGVDLAANEQLAQSLIDATVKNSTVVIAVPDGWPAARQLMVFQPAYKGRYSPKTPNARIRQADGGYFLIIDPSDYLDESQAEEKARHVNALNLSIEKNGQKQRLATKQFSHDGLLADSWFQPSTVKNSFALGDAVITLETECSRGMPVDHLLVAAGIVIPITAFLMALLSWSQERRSAVAGKLMSHENLRKERDRTSRTLHLLSDAVLTVDHHGIIHHVNTAGARFLGHKQHELIDRPLDNFLFLRYPTPSSKKFNALEHLQGMHLGGAIRLDLVADNTAEDETVFRCNVSLNAADSESQATAVFVFRDTSAETRFTRTLEYQANHDALTGCANRHFFEHSLKNLVDNQSACPSGSALLYIDLDQFKIINDSAGHAAGDKMLKYVTENLSQIVDSEHTLVRLGGDEFGVLMRDASPATAQTIAERILDRFQSMAFHFEKRCFPIRASLGLVHFSETGSSPSEVMAAADLACYAAKDLGRNSLYVYHADDTAMALRTTELEWLPLLRLALEKNLFELFAQPLVDTQKPDKVVLFELLLRLKNEEGNYLAASEVVSAAERYGMIRDIDRWVINEGLLLIADMDKRYRDVKFSINLSGQSAADSSLIGYIEERVSYYKVDPSRLCFEITETAAISNFANAVDLSKAIRKMGARIALDDFGSGLSSFAYLKHLRIDVLKIDGQFIRDLASNKIDVAMVQAIQDIARSMQITTVAEFVKSDAILAVLAEIGIDMAQGFYLGKPLPVKKALIAASASLPARLTSVQKLPMSNPDGTGLNEMLDDTLDEIQDESVIS